MFRVSLQRAALGLGFAALWVTYMPIAEASPSSTAEKSVVTDELCIGSNSLDLEIEGFGADTVGGWQEGFVIACVVTLDDDGPGSLRDSMRTNGQPTVVRFGVDGVIQLSAPILVPSNITVDGRGHDITLSGKGFAIHGQSQVILTNLAIEDVYDTAHDGIQVGTVDRPSDHVVLDHLRFSQTTGEGSSDYVDEAISVIFGSNAVTVQWCRFDEWEKVLLAGNGDADPDVDKNLAITMHHNFFNQTGRRHPRGRYGQFDVYNNYFYDWHMFTWAGPPGWHLAHGAKCDEGCRMRVEANVFERYWHPQDIFSDANKATMCEKGGRMSSVDNWVHPDTDVDLRFDWLCRRNDWVRPYTALIDEAGPRLMEAIVAGAGNTL